MKDLYLIAGFTKQALLKYRQRKEYMKLAADQVIEACQSIRKDHKRMSCRKMYVIAQESVSVGRDLFEDIGFNNGFKVKVKRNVIKTTWSQKIEVYPNLLEGLTINGINQAWQSDIFYLPVEGKNYYGVSIIDIYSRYLLSLYISRSLEAIETGKALLNAIQERKGQPVKGCIFHSDRGTQYISDLVKTIVQDHKLRPSMCLLPQENAYVERVQGTLKYEYLFEENLTDANIKAQVRKIKDLYNHKRPHAEIGMLTPSQYEQRINNSPLKEHPKLKVFQWKHPLLTKSPVINKKEKSSKKEKNYSNINY